MAYNNLIQEIDSYIRTNGEGEISAEVLNGVLKDIVNPLGKRNTRKKIWRNRKENEHKKGRVIKFFEFSFF